MSATTNVFFNVRELINDDNEVFDGFVATAKRGGEDQPYAEVEEVDGKFVIPEVGTLTLKQSVVVTDSGVKYPLKFTTAGTPFIVVNSIGERAKFLLAARPR